MLQNDFERWSEEYFSEIARQCGILIQESAPSESNLAHYWPIGSSLATFATQSAHSDAPPQDGRASLSAQSGNGAIITPMRRFPPPWTIEEQPGPQEGRRNVVQEFITEDDLDTFEEWLTSQALDGTMMTPDVLAMWRRNFDEGRERSLATPKARLRNLRPDEHQYAVAVREGFDLWVTLWVKRSRKGEFFVMVPRGDRAWDPHTSYHLDGTLHGKSFGHTYPPKQLQPLTGTFRGTEHLGAHGGHGPKRVGAKCDPSAFSGVVEVPADALPRDGTVVVDLVEPGCDPISWPFTRPVVTEVFRDFVPWVVIRVGV